ncbi:MAG: phosphate acyltransferase [Alloprevotella sp.]
MPAIRHFEQIAERILSQPLRKRLAVVCATDVATIEAVVLALRQELVDVVFVGESRRTQAFGQLAPFASRISYVEASQPEEAARLAVGLIRRGQADILMKGLINTDKLLRAILSKQEGLLPAGNVLSHVAAFDIPGRDRLLFLTDAAVIPYPTLAQRREQIRYAAGVCRAFGIDVPRVALVHCSEHESPHFPHTLDYGVLKAEAAAGAWGDIVVDGPLDVLTACSLEALQTKGIDSPLQGEADALLCPDIETGNALYKALPLFAHARPAGMLVGAACPVVLPSRGDTQISKYYSIAMAALTA